MTSNTMKVLFLIARNRINQANSCAIKCRITFIKKRKELSTGLFVNPDYWDSKQQKVKPPEPDSEYINTQLSLIKTKINRAFLMLQIKEQVFTVEDIYTLYKGEKLTRDYKVIEYFESYLERLKKLINIEIKQVTWNKHYYTLNHVKSFIGWKYKKKDISLKKLKMTFINDLEFYLKTEKGHQQITINKIILRFRKSIKTAVTEGYIDKDPFSQYKHKKVKKKVIFLSADELMRLEEFHFVQVRLQQVKDMFIFCCYTGLPYREMANLNAKHIQKGFDGNLWINIERQKTEKSLSVPLLPKAKEILDKYKTEETLLPVISNQKFNSYLKEIADILGIEKRLTHHTARKTFASTVLLFNNVPMEIVAELLGHSSITITEASYGKVVQKNISKEMSRISNLLKPKT
jgi:integrase